jgi:hypothetical protein
MEIISEPPTRRTVLVRTMRRLYRHQFGWLYFLFNRPTVRDVFDEMDKPEQPFWSGRRDSNPLPQPWEVEALLAHRAGWPPELDSSGFVPVALLNRTTYHGAGYLPGLAYSQHSRHMNDTLADVFEIKFESPLAGPLPFNLDFQSSAAPFRRRSPEQ